MNAIIELKQSPIILYDLVEAKGKEVQTLIKNLDLQNITANEDNLGKLKSTRADLSRDFKVFEEQRKLVKDLIMKPYNDFDEIYKKNISILFKETDILLKDKIDLVDGGILDAKIDKIIAFFNLENKYDFVKFNDLNIKIIKSKTDKTIKDEIKEYLQQVENNLLIIKNLKDADRIMAKYQLTKDINSSIAAVQLEVEIEEKNKTALANAEFERNQRLEKEVETVREFQEERNEVIEKQEPIPASLVKTTFTVIGTMEQIKELKNYMNEKGLNYGK